VIPQSVSDEIDLGRLLDANQIEARLSTCLREIPSWSKGMRIWADDDDHRVALFYNRSGIEAIEARLDARKDPNHFFELICTLAREWNCVFLVDAYVCEPSVLELSEHYRKSTAFKVLEHPEETLKNLPRGTSDVIPMNSPPKV